MGGLQMTYVEFFDRISVENICSILTNVPNRVILVGDDKEKIDKRVLHYKKVFSERGYNIEFKDEIVSEWKIEEVVKILEKILKSYEDCVFGITGGNEIALVALGVLYGRNPDKKIQIHRIGIEDNKIYDCDNDGNTIYKKPPKLSIEENIRIYGGDITYGELTETKTYLWSLKNEFCQDVETMWSICKESGKNWNKQIDIFEIIEEVGTTSIDGLRVRALKRDIPNWIQTAAVDNQSSCIIDRNIKSELCGEKLITSFQENETEVVISYKNLQVKKCLTKAGMVLELKVYLTARQLKDVKGNKIYNDALNGVVIDWDGEIHESRGENHDIINEIDVMLMHGMVPVFVSCKNGNVTVEELYKLNTVAERFGGIYSKKVLVTSKLNVYKGSKVYFKQRAEDMGIKILENVHKMNNAKLAQELSGLWKD